jgi:hypothetical protein
MAKRYQAQRYIPVITIITVFCSFIFYAFSTGITGETLKNGNGCYCHDVNPTVGVNVVISGPDTLQINETGNYTVTITGGPLVRGGTNIAASNGSLGILNADLQIMGDELTHVAPKLPASGSVTFQFSYTAPATVGNQTLYANGNSVNFNGDNTGDQWNYALNKNVVIIPEVPVELTGFTASVSGNNVTLLWTTATETNNNGYEIQRSIDNLYWEIAGFVNGAGNSVVNNNYSFTDNNLKTGEYYYRLKQIDFGGSYEIFNLTEVIKIEGPADFVLSQNYPNPFNPSTKINYSIPFDGNISLKIYNPLGKEVAELVNGFTTAGSYSAYFNAADLSSGVYYYELRLTDQSDQNYNTIKKMILLK